MIRLIIYGIVCFSAIVFCGCYHSKVDPVKEKFVRNDSVAYADSISEMELKRQKAAAIMVDTALLKDSLNHRK